MKKMMLTYFLPFVILGVAAFQLYKVYFEKLTRWKGGGFGMYSEMHPQTRLVWLKTGDTTREIKYLKKPLSVIEREAALLVHNPSPENLRSFSGKLATQTKLSNFRVEIWEPELNPANQTLSLKLIAHATFSE